MFYLKIERPNRNRECDALTPHSVFLYPGFRKTLPSHPEPGTSLLTATAFLGTGFSVPGFAEKMENAPEFQSVPESEHAGVLSVTVPPLRNFPEIHLEPAKLIPGKTVSVTYRTFLEPSANALEFDSAHADGFSCTVINPGIRGTCFPSAPRTIHRFRADKQGKHRAGRFICIRNHQFNL